MKVIPSLTVFAAVCTLASCSSNKAPSELLVEANKVHLEAVEIYEQAHDLFGKLKSEAEAQKDSLHLASLDSIHDVLHHWKDGLYEVPGFEHAHDHHSDGGDGHDHSHKPAPNMTDQSMLDYQKTAKQAIEELLNFLQTKSQQ